MEWHNNLTGVHALVYTLLNRIDVLEARVTALETENVQLKVENAALNAENDKLQVALGMNSKNSHKPPSTDISLKKPLSRC